jgi:phage/plasmid-like protein (TIGR03299 family)
MIVNAESIFYANRETLWHGTGSSVGKASTSAEALKMAGLDWRVEYADVQVYGRNVANKRATFMVGARMLDDKGQNRLDWEGRIMYHPDTILGVVSDSYRIVQNEEAFAFADHLLGEGAVYEKAGSLRGGKVVWMLARMPRRKILEDDVDPYMCIVNSHDGSSSIKVCCTPVRVVCNNTLNLALKKASRMWSVRHIGAALNIGTKLDEARRALNLASCYMDELGETARHLASQSITDAYRKDFINAVFPMPPDADKPGNEGKKNGTLYLRDLFNIAYAAADIEKFRGTKWGLVNALSDAVYHRPPIHQTKNYRQNLLGSSIGGNRILDKAMKWLADK